MGKSKAPPTDVGEPQVHINGGILYWLTVIFICNPLTMFFFNLFAPRKASEFIYTWRGSGTKLKNFYMILADQTPFYWNKYWMQRAGVEHYSPSQQTKYYLQFDTTGKTLRKLDDGTVCKLFFSTKNKLIKEQIYENCRANDDLFTSLCLGKCISDLRRLVEPGPLGKGQVFAMIKMAKCEVLEGGKGSQKFPLTDFLADYVRMFKMDEEIIDELRNFDVPKEHAKVWFDRINPAIETFKQRLFTKDQQKNHDVRPWRNFCKTTKGICPEAQVLMNQKQHLIFYENGHRLSQKAIVYFLRGGNPARFDLILRHERKDVFGDEAMSIINANEVLCGIYQKHTVEYKPKVKSYVKKPPRPVLSSEAGVKKEKSSDARA